MKTLQSMALASLVLLAASGAHAQTAAKDAKAAAPAAGAKPAAPAKK